MAGLGRAGQGYGFDPMNLPAVPSELYPLPTAPAVNGRRPLRRARTLTLGLVLCAVLFAALLYSGKVSRPAWADGGIALPSNELRQEIADYRDQIDESLHEHCQPGLRPYPRTVWEIPRRELEWRLEGRIAKLRAVRSQISRCPAIPHRALWKCIHRQEGAWDDPHPPYFGGLQMGYWFMREYGDTDTYGWPIYRSQGTADQWPREDQMGVAEAAYGESGYSRSWLYGQWPATAPPCLGRA